MNIIRPKDFTGVKAWDALDIESIDNASVRLHWTDEPYKWHINDGPEVFVVLDGQVDMYTRVDSKESVHHLNAGDIFHAEDGDEHIARPNGIARVLVVESAGSI